MRFSCVAFDYDGTLAIEGKVCDELLNSLVNVKAQGRNIILVTGRILKDLHNVFGQYDLFDYVVAENGAVLYCPTTKITRLLSDPLPIAFLKMLKDRGINPLEIGRVIVSTWHPNENAILEAIHDFGLDLHVSFNKGAVMVLPAGVNKATGLKAALSELNQSLHNTVGVGDGENDFVFMEKCEYAVAVQNALPVLKEMSDLVLQKDNGQGVIEFLDHVLLTEKFEWEPAQRHKVLLGFDSKEKEIRIPGHNCKVMMAGPSQAGKSTACMSFLSQLNTQGFQFCLIDPEGEYDQAPHSVIVGNEHNVPEISDILRLLLNPDNNVVINLLGVPLDERPQYFLQTFSALQEIKRKFGRPHWLVVDEAHHMLHSYWDSMIEPLWQKTGSFMIVTIDPNEISKSVLEDIDVVIAIGTSPTDTFNRFAAKIHMPPVAVHLADLSYGQSQVWFRKEKKLPIHLKMVEAPLRHKRHLRKYAEGNLGRSRSFYFTGKKGQLNIRCQNLFLFMQVGDGIDDETWLYHLKRNDFSTWIRDSIHDPGLAIEINEIEKSDYSCTQSKVEIKKAIEKRYSMPAIVFD